jgi:iron complex outermembrane receptor protein
MVASQQLTYTANNWSVSFVSKYVGEQYMGNIDAERSKLESYLINDIQVQALLQHNEGGPSLNLNVHLHNIFDELISSNGYFYTYDDDYSVPNVVTTIEGVGYYPQAGRHFMAGLTLQF